MFTAVAAVITVIRVYVIFATILRSIYGALRHVSYPSIPLR